MNTGTMHSHKSMEKKQLDETLEHKQFPLEK